MALHWGTGLDHLSDVDYSNMDYPESFIIE